MNYQRRFQKNLYIAFLLLLFSFFWLFLLSYHFPFMYNDDITYITEAAKGFSFPEGPIFFPRFFFIYVYKLMFYFVGFQAFYFHLVKTFFGAAFIFVYYSFARQILCKKYAFFSSLLLLSSALFISTTTWIAEPITLALLFSTLILYLLLFYPETFFRNVLLLFLVPAALFTKETNVVLLPLLFYYSFFKEQGIKKLYSLFPIVLFFIYLFFVPTRDLGTITVSNMLSNISYFLIALSKYYTPLFVLFVFLFLVFFAYHKIKKEALFHYEHITLIFLWFVLSFMIFLLPINHEERYLMILLPSFLLLFFLGLEEVSKTPFYQKFKKIFRVLLSILFCYIFLFNIYGIVKFEIGWGSFFRGVDAVATKIDVEYPGSLLVYQSGTGDFFSEFHNFSVMQFGEHLNITALSELQVSGNYSHVFYVQYPERMRAFSESNLTAVDKAFIVKEGIYEFEIYELK